MKQIKRITAAALAATALTALLGSGTASATTLEVGGVKQLGSVSIVATLASGTSVVLRDTSGFSTKTCTGAEIAWKTESPYSGATLTGKVSNLAFSGCSVTVHKGGTLHIAHESNSTSGTVTSSGAEFTTVGPFGTLACVTGAGTHLGTLVGVAAGHALLHVNAVSSCSGISKRWTGTYTVTTPTGLGVVA